MRTAGIFFVVFYVCCTPGCLADGPETEAEEAGISSIHWSPWVWGSWEIVDGSCIRNGDYLLITNPGFCSFTDGAFVGPYPHVAGMTYTPGFGPDDLDDDLYITYCYNAVLTREPDPDGYHYWLDLLTRRVLTREQIWRYFFDSPEYASRNR